MEIAEDAAQENIVEQETQQTETKPIMNNNVEVEGEEELAEGEEVDREERANDEAEVEPEDEELSENNENEYVTHNELLL